jgi:hypothetical protein
MHPVQARIIGIGMLATCSLVLGCLGKEADDESGGDGPGWCAENDLPARHTIAQPAEEHRNTTFRGIGDFDGDGAIDIALAASADYDHAAEFRVLRGGPMSAPLPDSIDAFLETAATIEIVPEHADHHPGQPVGIGDFDGDGFDDLWIFAREACRVADPEACPEPPGEFPIPPACELVCEGQPDGYLVRGRAGDEAIDLVDVRDGVGGTIIEESPGVSLKLYHYHPQARGLDMDGDGRSDLVVARNDENGPAVAVVLGHELGGPIRFPDIGVGTPGFRMLANPDQDGNGDYFGSRLTPAGDVDGDGFEDLLVGDHTHGGSQKGRVYLIHGPGLSEPVAELDDLVATGEVQAFDGEPGSWGTGGNLGEAIAGPGDMDGDGFDDLALLAPSLALDNRETGRLYLIRGGAEPRSRMVEELVGGSEFGTSVEAGTWWFGEEMVGPGDVDGDGLGDLLIEGFTDTGAHLFLLHGGPIDQALSLDSERVTEVGLPPDLSYGYAGLHEHSVLGDLDCDGENEVTIGYDTIHLLFDLPN